MLYRLLFLATSTFFFVLAVVLGSLGMAVCLLQLEVGGFVASQFIVGFLCITLACYLIGWGIGSWRDYRYS